MIKRLLLAIFVISAVVNASTLDVGLVAHYTFDGNMNDSSGNNYNSGTYIGTNYYYGGSDVVSVTTTFSSNRLFNNPSSSSVYLNGSTTLRAQVPTPSYPNNNSWSWSIWLKPSELGVDRFLISRTDLTNDWSINPLLATTGLGSKYITNDGLYSQTPLQTSVWQQIVITSDQNGDRSFYIDGALDNTSGGHVLYQDLGMFNIGSLQNSPGFIGNVDDVRIYNRALSSIEVASLYATESVPEPSAISLHAIGLGVLAMMRRRRS